MRKQALVNFHKDLKGKRKVQNTAKIAMQSAIEKETMERFKEDNKKRALIQDIQDAITGGLMDPSSPLMKGRSKRVASAQLAAEQENYKKQEQHFDAIIKCQCRASTLAECYIAAFGTDPPDEPVLGPSLDL